MLSEENNEWIIYSSVVKGTVVNQADVWNHTLFINTFSKLIEGTMPMVFLKKIRFHVTVFLKICEVPGKTKSFHALKNLMNVKQDKKESNAAHHK